MVGKPQSTIADALTAPFVGEDCLPLIQEHVDAVASVSEPLSAVRDALNLYGFDEVMISTLRPLVSRWLHLDPPHKVAALGVPVTTITAAPAESTARRALA